MLLLLLFRYVLAAVLGLAGLPPGGPAPADEAQRVPVFGPLGAAPFHRLPARVTVTHPGPGQYS